MNRITSLRLGLVSAVILCIELLCRTGVINKRVLNAPSDMVLKLCEMFAQGLVTADLFDTLSNVFTALILSVIGGFLLGSALHGQTRLRRALEPFLASYYALPFFAFYPVLIVLLGVGRTPIVAIGFLFGVVAMLIATLNGFDRIPRVLNKTARLYHMRPLRVALKIKLPYAMPYIFTGVKLALAYAFIGVIAAEFIFASSGLGYSIAYAFTTFDNRTMYALMLLVIILVSAVNGIVHVWEQAFLARRGK